MPLDKLTQDDIIAYVQYEQGNNEFFRLDDDKAIEIKALIESNAEYAIMYEEIKTDYPSDLNKVKESNIPYLSAAAVLIIMIFSYIMFMPNNSNIISMKDFNLKIERSQTDSASTDMSQWVFELREENYEDVIDALEGNFEMSGSIVYATALILHGQKTENVALVKQGKAILFTHDVTPELMKKIDHLIKILEND